MPASRLVVDYLDTLVNDRGEDFRLALAVPRSGTLGLARPAGLAAAIMAAEEINDAGGVRDRRLTLTPVDAGLPPAGSARELEPLVAAVDAVVGFHTSDVHRALERVTSGRVPYIFAAPHEGGARLPGVGLLGPSPAAQLGEPVRALVERGLRSWALLGSDYIWPRRVHAVAERLIRHNGAQVRSARLVPLGRVDGDELASWVRRSGAQVVLVSLVGRDLAVFNRAFAGSRVAGSVVRVSGALEEVGLLEVDGDDTGGLFSAMPWYVEDDPDGFGERYATRWGAMSPQVGAYARGCYDAVHAVAAASRSGRLSAHAPGAGLPSGGSAPPNRLACADGMRLVPVDRA
ncbi:ABC transporter substrate-binding protein [Mobilicoccus pelagius]|uniref:Acetamidase regulator n=1 Tax=Mobilicoccus pelagius NBRC 104925 TaxID=1089455 RepID=H5UPM6_9MICO|nr:ABC transporter substrate-binding protein [Mobilicoccus pelagius]GAB47684.1 acetamidase regulator [Mobilicoccus pelagius NBRC 104925]